MKMLRQTGMSLTEMLISLAISMVVIGGVVSIYTSTIGTSSATLKASKLNQELTAVLSVMVNDIRRAGYSAEALYTNPQDNKFSQPGNTALQVFDEYITQGDCIVYAYDSDKDQTLDSTDVFGFRLDVGNDGNRVIKMRESGDVATYPNDLNNCDDDHGTWKVVTDDTIINIEELSFSLVGSECLNTREPNGLDENSDGVVDDDNEYNCDTTDPNGTAPNAGDVLVLTRQVTITIDGELATDTNVKASVSQMVRVRNDLVMVQ